MGVAILSGVILSLESLNQHGGFISNGHQKWESHTPGTSTPIGAPDATLPDRFLACVNREQTVKRVTQTFHALGGRGTSVEVSMGKNVSAVQASDVILLWYVHNMFSITLLS